MLPSKVAKRDSKIKLLRLSKSVTCSQFHQRYTRMFFVQIFQQSQNVTRKMMFVQKIRTYNVDEIDTCSADYSIPKDVTHRQGTLD